MMLCYSARLFLNALNATTETFRKESKATDSKREEREMGKAWKEWRLDTVCLMAGSCLSQNIWSLGPH